MVQKSRKNSFKLKIKKSNKNNFRLIDKNEDDKQIKTNWTELKHFVRCIYRQTGTGISGKRIKKKQKNFDLFSNLNFKKILLDNILDINSKEDFEKFRDNVKRY
jgi:hypothetical protein